MLVSSCVLKTMESVEAIPWWTLILISWCFDEIGADKRWAALPLKWSQFILILCSILIASLFFHPNRVKFYGLKVNVQRRKLMFSDFQFSITICSAFQNPCASVITRSTSDDISCSSDTGNPFASTPATFRLANSADIWPTTYPSATCQFRPLDGTSVPASAVSAISSLARFLHVGITVSELSMAIGFSPLSRS